MIPEQQINDYIRLMRLTDSEAIFLADELKKLKPFEIRFYDNGYSKRNKNWSFRISDSEIYYQVKQIEGYPFDGDKPIGKKSYTKGNRFLEISYAPETIDNTAD